MQEIQSSQTNPIVTLIQTKDQKIYKVDRDLFCKYSKFYRTMMQDNEDEIFPLVTINSKEFDYIYEFLQLHRTNEPQPLGIIYPQVRLADVMEIADAELLYRIFAQSPQKVKAVVDAAFFLHIDFILKRLAAGMMSNLNKEETKLLVEQSKKSNLISEQQLSSQIHKKIEMILVDNKKQQLIETQENAE